MAETRTESAQMVGAGAATLAAIAGAGALVLAILGLNQVLPTLMVQVATIVVGAGLMIEGSSLTAHLAQARQLLGPEERVSLGSSISAEMLGGVATVVLGVLAIVGIAPTVLVPVAAIVAGASLLIGGGAQEQARRKAAARGFHRVLPDTELELEHQERQHLIDEATRAAVSVATGADVLVGLGAATLGVLALLGIDPLVLSLVAMLAMGIAILLGGGAIGARLAQMVYRIG